MKTKTTYIAPNVELIELDSQISLALESTPPLGPDEELFSFHAGVYPSHPFQDEI